MSGPNRPRTGTNKEYRRTVSLAEQRRDDSIEMHMRAAAKIDRGETKHVMIPAVASFMHKYAAKQLSRNSKRNPK
jgi:hypothetical protein